jgi:two-component system chemotaxis response regulator CheY
MLREDVGILVVDDVNAMRVQIRDLLKGFGFRKIHLASNGEEAKLHLNTETIQLVLADWRMEPVDGLALLRHVRADEKLKGLAFILVTAETARERVIEAVQAGVDNYLVKPLTPVEIQNKVYGTLLKKQVL